MEVVSYAKAKAGQGRLDAGEYSRVSSARAVWGGAQTHRMGQHGRACPKLRPSEPRLSSASNAPNIASFCSSLAPLLSLAALFLWV